MQCMKCGRETDSSAVFCDTCLSKMESAPVKPGTPVVIPKRPEKFHAPVVKKEKPEDIIFRLRRRIRALIILITSLSILLGLSIGVIVFHYTTTDHDAPAIGQNYSTESPEDRPLSR